MRSFLLVAVAATLLVAGCAAPATTPSTQPTPGPNARVLYAPDCSIATADGNWTEPCVAKASHNPSPSKTEIDIAVNPVDPLNAIVGSKDLDRQASNCVWAVPQVTHDGGKSWKTTYIGGKKADRKPGDALFGWECITDPILVFDSKGVAHYSLQLYNFASGGAESLPVDVPNNPVANLGSAIIMTSSKDGGDSWSDFVTLHAGDGTAAFHDYMRMAASPKTNTVFTVWNQISSAGPAGAAVPVLVAVKQGAARAEAPVYLPVPDEPGGAGETALFVDAKGTVFVILQGATTTYLTQSTDDGVTFSQPLKMFGVKPIKSPLPHSKFRTGTSTEGAVDRSGGAHDGCIYTVWSDGAKGEGDSDILTARSCDKGKSWSNATRVHHDTTKSDQIMPRVAVGSADGTVHVVYLTRAYDANNTLLDAEYAYSTDGGASWATKRLTTTSFDGDLGVHQNGFPFFGDYIGIDSAGARTYAAFPDSSTGVAEVGVAALARVAPS